MRRYQSRSGWRAGVFIGPQVGQAVRYPFTRVGLMLYLEYPGHGFVQSWVAARHCQTFSGNARASIHHGQAQHLTLPGG